MIQDKIPCIYLLFYYHIKKISNGDDEITLKQAIKAMNKVVFRIPNRMYHMILDDMETYGLLKKLNKQRYCMLDSKYYRMHADQIKEYFFW